MIDFTLTDAQRELQRTARTFAEREILPRIHELDSTSTYDRSLYEKMGAEASLACRSQSGTAAPASTTSRSRCCARRWNAPTPRSG